MFGKKLKECRGVKGVTQKQVAEYLDVTVTTYQRYELELSEPNIETISKLADFFDVSLDFLFGRSDIYERK